MTSERNGQRPPGRSEASEAGPSPDGDDALGGHADFIRRGPVLWNAFRDNNPNLVPDLTGLALDWCERRLGVRDGGPVDLKFARLQQADLCFADLEGADLEAADLARADLQHARLVEAKLNAADLIEARLDHADLAGAQAKKADFGGCALRFARLSTVDFRGADLSGADLLHAQCRDADFSGADLTNARLDHADLAGAKFAGANLAGASLHHARNLTREQLEEATGSDMTSLPPELEGAVSWSVARKNTLKSRGARPAEQPGAARRGGPRPVAWISGVAVLALLAAGLALQLRSDAVPLSVAISAGAPDQAPRETKRAVKPDAYAAFLPPPADTASIGAPKGLAASRAAEGLAPSMAQELAPAPTALATEVAAHVDALAAFLPPTDTVSGGAAAEGLAPSKAQQLTPASAGALAASHVDAMSAAATAEVDAAAEIAPAAVIATSPDREFHAATPSARDFVDVPDAVVLAAQPDEVDSPSAETVSALSAEARTPALRLVVDPHLDLPVADVVMIRVASRIDGLRPVVVASRIDALRPVAAVRVQALQPVVPAGAARAVEIAALPGELPASEQQPGATTAAEAPVEPGPPEPLLLTVSLLDQTLNVYRGLELIESTKVSSGARGYETRTGVFSILEKKRYHHSNLYSNAPMPYMQRLTRSGTALHAGVVPNYPASHGCVRLPFSFAPKLFKITEVGANVVVAGPMPEPRLIDHPKLFHPVAVQADAAASETASEKSARPLRMLVTRRTDRDKFISVQRRLAELGYLEPQRFTGKLGGPTTVAIKEFQKASGVRATGEITGELIKSLHEAAGKPQPPEGHLFVRQGYKRLFDVPVVFSNPAEPLGTHAFTALQFAPEDTKVSWVTVTVEGDAAAALDRIEIPEEARQKISGLLTPGATFIIADKSEHSAILPEGDDFIISATEIPSSGPKLAAATPAPQSVKKAKSRPKARRTARHYYYAPPQRVRRGFFFRW